MKEKRNSKYARQEIELAKSSLAKRPKDDTQKDRLAWWSAYLGDYETAHQYAVSDRVKEYIKQCETS
jgi:hypothetical protein